jgi:hypothetical protein
MTRRTTRGTGHVTGQNSLPGMDWNRLYSRINRTRDGDPLTHPDGCTDCTGTGVNTDQPDPSGTCGTCGGCGWKP